MITTLSFLSLSSSSSNSFQPSMARSTSTSCIGDAVKPLSNAASSSSLCITIPPPDPPKVNEGLITMGSPICCANSFPSSSELAVFASATGTPSAIIHFLNNSRSSALSIALISTPINRTLNRSHIPNSSPSLARLSAVCPPMVGSTASISFSSSICSMLSTVSGNR